MYEVVAKGTEPFRLTVSDRTKREAIERIGCGGRQTYEVVAKGTKREAIERISCSFYRRTVALR